MATNPAFNNWYRNSERSLFEDTLIEGIKVKGIDVKYIPRVWITTDDILNEVTASEFNHAYEIEAIVTGIESYVNNSYLLDKVGFGIPNTVTCTVSKRRFKEEVPQERPMEGDLIFIEPINLLLEVKFAEPDNMTLSAGKMFKYELRCEFYRHGSEDMPDGILTNFTDMDQVPQALLDGKLEEDGIMQDSSKMSNAPALIDNAIIKPERR